MESEHIYASCYMQDATKKEGNGPIRLQGTTHPVTMNSPHMKLSHNLNRGSLLHGIVGDPILENTGNHALTGQIRETALHFAPLFTY